MAGDDGGRPLERDDAALEFEARQGVEPVERLVQEKILRPARERERRERLPLHALGEIADWRAAFERKEFFVTGKELVVKRIEALVELDELFHRRPRRVVGIVGQKEELFALFCVARDVFPVIFDRAFVGAQDVCHHAKERRLARAVDADEPEHRSIGHRQGDAAQDLLRPITFP